MGLFGNKNKEGNASTKPAKPVKPQKRKTKNELTKVFDESVWESVREDFKSNRRLTMFGADGQVKYIGLMFDTNDIGGLAGKAAKKDESKGSIIEAIRTGRIKTYIRNEMLLDDAILIIPDQETLDNMSEFIMLTNIDYTVCSVTDDGVICIETQNGTENDDDPDLKVSYRQIADLVSTNGDVRTIFPYLSSEVYTNSSAGFDKGNVTPEDFISEPEEILDLDDDPDAADDDLSDLGGGDMSDVSGVDMSDLEDIPEDVPEDGSDDISMNGGSDSGMNMGLDFDNDSAFNQDDFNENSDVEMDQDFNAGGYPEGDEYENEDVTDADVKDYTTRRFYSDDLGLEVSSDPFDAQFLNGNPYIPFKEDRGSGWLNEYLSNMSKDANTRMERLHNENLFRMRERYMRLIQGHCESIAKSLDISDDSTQYGRMRFAIEQNKAYNMDNMQATIEAKQERLRQSWNAKLDAVANEAADSARRQYIEENEDKHEKSLQLIEMYEKDEIERDYQSSMRQMNDDRRAEASKCLDLAISETLSDLSGVYLRVLRDEKKEYARLQNEMTRFIDDNRKDEKARIDALAEENRQVKKANEVRNDYTAKIKALSAEFDMKRSMLQADIDRIKHENEVFIENSEREWSAKISDERKKSDDLQQKLDELIEKYADLDAKKDKEYSLRISELENINRNKDDMMDHMVESHKRSNTITALLVIAIIIASLGVGFMVGSIINVRKASQIEKDGIYQQVQPVQQAEPQQSQPDVTYDNTYTESYDNNSNNSDVVYETYDDTNNDVTYETYEDTNNDATYETYDENGEVVNENSEIQQ